MRKRLTEALGLSLWCSVTSDSGVTEETPVSEESKDLVPVDRPAYSPGIFIANTHIRQDDEGRYCLNDLHKASGGKKKHQPSDWMRNQTTKALIEELTVPGHLGYALGCVMASQAFSGACEGRL